MKSTQLDRDYFINHCKKTLLNNHYNGKNPAVCFFRGSSLLLWHNFSVEKEGLSHMIYMYINDIAPENKSNVFFRIIKTWYWLSLFQDF